MLGIKRNRYHYTAGNRVELLINGEAFFPRLIERIERAQQEILVETYILGDDPVGCAIKDALIRAVNRGVWVCLTVDSLGSYRLSSDYIEELAAAGVVFQVYDPQSLWRFKALRRSHRKLVVIDGVYAYMGGMNLSYDQMLEFGQEAKQDYMVELEGPVVAEVRALAKSLISDAHDEPRVDAGKRAIHGHSQVALVVRDNNENRRDIEKAYLQAIRGARQRIWIANAYFFPGYRMIWALRRARRKGVDVRLIMQGNPDVAIALMAVRTLYEKFIRSGISIYEYKVRQLHAKVAVVDDDWSTIGSSNLDPISLAFNLEANIVVRGKAFNKALATELQFLQSESEFIAHDWVRRRSWWLLAKDFLMYQVLRHFPGLANSMPSSEPSVLQVETGSGQNLRGIKRQAKSDSPQNRKNVREPEKRS